MLTRLYFGHKEHFCDFLKVFFVFRKWLTPNAIDTKLKWGQFDMRQSLHLFSLTRF